MSCYKRVNSRSTMKSKRNRLTRCCTQPMLSSFGLMAISFSPNTRSGSSSKILKGLVPALSSKLITSQQIPGQLKRHVSEHYSQSLGSWRLKLHVKRLTVSSGIIPGPVPANSKIARSFSKSKVTALLISMAPHRAGLSDNRK